MTVEEALDALAREISADRAAQRKLADRVERAEYVALASFACLALSAIVAAAL